MPLDVDGKVSILSGATTTGAGSAISVTGEGRVAVEARGKTSSGTGAAIIEIQVSNDNSVWKTVGTINLDLRTEQISDRLAIDANWTYVRANVASISGTGASVSVYKITGVEGVTYASTSVVNINKLEGLPTVGFLNIQRQTSGPNLYLDCISDHASNGHAVYNMRRANGTPAALTGVVAGDEYGAIACRVYNGTDWEDHSGSLSWGATQDHTPTANGSGFGIYTILNDTVGSWEALSVDGLGKTSIKGGLLVSGNLSTTLDLFSTVPAAQTTSFNGVNVQLSTAAASFTLADLFQFRIRNASLGAGSAITRQTGIRVEDLTSGASNYGIRSLVSSGSSKWNLFIDGTANNYILGNCGFGTNAPTQPVDVSGAKIRIRTANTPASATDTGAVGEICWDADYVYVCVSANTWKRAALSTW